MDHSALAIGDQGRQSGPGRRITGGLQDPGAGAQADGGPRRESADHHHGHGPATTRIRRQSRRPCQQHDQLELVAQRDELQGCRRLADDREFVKEFVAQEKFPTRTTSTPPARPPASSTRTPSSAGSIDKKKVRDALAATDISTFYGPIKVQPQRHEPGARASSSRCRAKPSRFWALPRSKNADLMLLKVTAQRLCATRGPHRDV